LLYFSQFIYVPHDDDIHSDLDYEDLIFENLNE